MTVTSFTSYALIALGLASASTLFFRSFVRGGADLRGEATLWGLFIVGITAGILLSSL